MKKFLDLDGQIAEAKSYAKSFGAKYIGQRKNKYGNYFGFAKDGFEDRWTRLSSLRRGGDPFSVPTTGELEAEAKSYEEKFGAKYIGRKVIKGTSYFGFAKDGFEDRWTHINSLRRNSNPFSVPTVNELEAEAMSYAKEFDAKYIGCKREIAANGKLASKFGFAKDGFEDRWILMGGLRKGGDPFYPPTINEQENEAKSYEKKLGAKYLGWKNIKGYNYFGFAKDGFEDRWIIILTLRRGGNPFTSPTIGEQEAEAKSYEERLSAKYLGWKNIKGFNYFGFSKEGFEDRWITLHNLRLGKNPFNLLTISEQETEAKSYTKTLGAKYIGWKHLGGHNLFGFAKEGFDDRWVHLSSLRKSCNPFTVLTINELEIIARAHAKKLGAKYVGWKNIDNFNHFCFVKDGFDDRWLSTSDLRRLVNPYLSGTIGEQEAQALAYAKRVGAKYLGYRKGKSCNQFGFAKDGFDDRWVNLSQTRNGRNSFNDPTIGEMEAEAKSYEEKFDAKYIGWKRERNLTYFGFAKDGFDDRWVHLGNIRKGSNPFNLATDDEHETEAKSHEKRLGAKYIGWRKGKGTHKQFGFSKEGHKDRWTHLGNLRDGRDPFAEGGFDVDKIGYFYILLVVIGAKQYIKFGITNNKRGRMKIHTKTLAEINGQWEQLHIKRFKSGQECQDFESNLKRMFKDKIVNLGVDGFKSECFSHSIKDALFSQVL